MQPRNLTVTDQLIEGVLNATSCVLQDICGASDRHSSLPRTDGGFKLEAALHAVAFG